MTDDERDEILIRVDERVDVLRTEMVDVQKGLSDLADTATGARAGMFVLLSLGGVIAWVLTTTNALKSIWPWS